ncbi:MAG: hypothetical protein Q9227_002406 [Pyrenula ochraceoflavens]
MVFQPPAVEVGRDTLPELAPIFTFLNSHQNKLYQEGYFLKLNDLDSNGRPNADRNWTECFAQLVGTVLSLWDAAALDAAGQDGEVAPTFINLADASIKMIKTLPTRNQDVQPLENVLSISTAGKNRYLLHFNTLHSLTQWTAGIRLSMFEHSSLLELYTGSLIAGKGKALNNIRTIMERARFPTQDWCRVITPGDEKEFQRQQKTMKKRSAYERPAPPKGHINFYDTKKIKKNAPIATINDAYAAYAIYPHSKPLIDASTLVKLEGRITIHSNPPSTTEGFVFVMPEVHPAVSGFEMMLRWLFPTFDTFGMYGRPSRLIADTLDPRGVMFAMPKHRRYGYLEIFDVATLIHTDGSQDWSEREWRKKLKELTSKRMNNIPTQTGTRTGSRRGRRSSMYGSLRYDDSVSIRSTPSQRNSYSQSTDNVFAPPKKSFTGPPGQLPAHNYHARSVSETAALGSLSRKNQDPFMSRTSLDRENSDMPDILESPAPPLPPAHSYFPPSPISNIQDTGAASERDSSESERRMPMPSPRPEDVQGDMRPSSPPAPVAAPPEFAHLASDRPANRPNQAPELIRARSRMSVATLSQLADANKPGMTGGAAAAGAAAAWKNREGTRDESNSRGVNDLTSAARMTADQRSAAQVTGTGAKHGRTQSNLAPTAPPVPVHRSLGTTSSDRNVARKPVPPPRGTVEQSAAVPPRKDALTGPSSHGLAQPQSSQPELLPFVGSKNFIEDADDASDVSPDYASSTPSEPSKEPEYRPRTGVLKTVGTPQTETPGFTVGDTRYGNTKTNENTIPSIDFGPTRALDPGMVRRPSTAGELERSNRRSQQWPKDDANRHHMRTDSPTSMEIGKENSSNRAFGAQSIPWQPGTAVGRRTPGGRILTPEEFVTQRASPTNSPPPLYAHSRNKSSGNLPQRPSSGDWSKRKEVPPRPISRSSTHLMSTTNQDLSSHLTAQEQEHVARMTNSPFLNMSSNRPSQPSNVTGLVSAIEAREREKKAFKEGLSGQMVQQAILQRQQQAAQAAQAAYSPQQQQPQSPAWGYSPTQPGWMPGGFPQSDAPAGGGYYGWHQNPAPR